MHLDKPCDISLYGGKIVLTTTLIKFITSALKSFTDVKLLVFLPLFGVACSRRPTHCTHMRCIIIHTQCGSVVRAVFFLLCQACEGDRMDVARILVAAFPETVGVRDNRGRLPRDLVPNWSPPWAHTLGSRDNH